MNQALERNGKVACLERWDWIGMSVGLALALLTGSVLAHGRIFWEDEMLGWMLLRDPSWHHMISAWQQGADGGGLLFYLTGRTWLQIFGVSELSFRLYSATCFGLAFCALWIALRRFYAMPIVALALFNTWFFSPPIVTHMAEGRFYGLLMLGTALAVGLVVLAERVEGSPLWLCGLFFLVHGALLTSHMLGILYSGTCLLGLLVLELSERRFRPRLYLAGGLAWLLLLGERSAIRATILVGKPHFWTTPPTVFRFIGAYTAFSGEVALVLAVLGVLAIGSLRASKRGWRDVLLQAGRQRRPVYALLLAFLLIPIEMTVVGWFGPSLFTDRYLMPVAIAQVFLTAEALAIVTTTLQPGSIFERRAVRYLVAFAFGTLLLVWVFWHVQRIVPQREDYTTELTSRFPRGVPVVCEDAWAFTELIGRQHGSGVPYTFLLDWPQSVSQTAPRIEVTEYHLMENWRKAGYFSGSIRPIDGFLKENAVFYLLHRDPPIRRAAADGLGNPLFERLSADPEYQVLPFGGRNAAGIQDVWMVCRGTCDHPGGPAAAPLPVK